MNEALEQEVAAPEIAAEEIEKPRKVSLPKRGESGTSREQAPQPRRTRGPNKKKRAKRTPAPHWSAQQFAEQWEGLHALAAAMTQDPNLAIPPEKALVMGTALEATFAQYDLWWLLQGGAILQLAAATAVVEGPIIMYLLEKRRQKRGEQAATRQAAKADKAAKTVVPPTQSADPGPVLGG